MLNAECTSLVPYSLTILENVRLSLYARTNAFFSRPPKPNDFSLSRSREVSFPLLLLFRGSGAT
jgi:hypothetical protein